MESDSISVNFIKILSYDLPLKNNAVCYVACSGGLDSTVLAHLTAHAGIKSVLLHCNFNLRGKESDEDEKFVLQLADELGVKCLVKSFDTKRIAEENGESTQITARKLRYEWFEEIMGNDDHLLTAHHHNDNVETSLFNLIKGTGVKGLRGIPERRGRILRPLLKFTRQDLKEYALKNNLLWREDSSNFTNKYSRNYLRNKVIPSFKEINPSFIDTMKGQMEYFRRLESFYERGYQEFMRKSLGEYKGFKAIEISRVTYQPDYKLFLSDFFKRNGFNDSQIHDIFYSINGESGRIFESNEVRIIHDRNHWLLDYSFEDSKVENARLIVPGETLVRDLVFTTKIHLSENYKIDPNPNIAAIDMNKLKGDVVIRSWHEGDWFNPLGMKGKKKLSDFMIDAKIPLSLKEKILVVESGDEIVWVVGMRIDDRFKITSKTKNILHISVKDQKSI
ncbi:tRNA lysidine(34) synthetase TilS [Marinigracilibium pacificum]|uniref:tRNA(Ile)-lysidine synthase n=1 Tax=Marinigracilibium pacificum TaxID=2729599 RepID=A0A848J377_9BACT|nr:tRNA lysidine(34) synthetase TilS [Marinigracilibium pacificum]NMM50181.1 tRNA lysidine(34) synthetase TilS [Marinigracilibium pacificum]